MDLELRVRLLGSIEKSTLVKYKLLGTLLRDSNKDKLIIPLILNLFYSLYGFRKSFLYLLCLTLDLDEIGKTGIGGVR